MSNSLYIAAATEFKKNGIPPEIGRLIVESVLRRFTDDAMYVAVSRNANLENELAAKMSELEMLKAKFKQAEDINKEVKNNDTL